MRTGEFRCTYCREIVEEDQSALPKKDSRLLLAKFNEQLEPLYILLREVEGIKLAPEILEPEPVDINTIRGYVFLKVRLCIKNVYLVKIIYIFLIVSIQENRAVLGHLMNNGQVKLLECQVSWWKTPEWTLPSETSLPMTTQRITERRDPYG